MKRISLRLAVSIDELENVGRSVADFCMANGISHKEMYSLQLVCDEWITNIITHGYGESRSIDRRDEKPIEVSLSLDPEGVVTLSFIDDAPPFNPLKRPKPDLSLSVEERPIGGLGIHFILTRMDHCTYEREGGRNCLTLRKRTVLRPAQTKGGTKDEHTD